MIDFGDPLVLLFVGLIAFLVGTVFGFSCGMGEAERIWR